VAAIAASAVPRPRAATRLLARSRSRGKLKQPGERPAVPGLAFADWIFLDDVRSESQPSLGHVGTPSPPAVRRPAVIRAADMHAPAAQTDEPHDVFTIVVLPTRCGRARR